MTATALASPGGLIAALVLGALCAGAGWMATRWVTAALGRRRVLDHPNARSSHSAPTPRGGGIAILSVALPLMAVLVWLHQPPGSAAWFATLAIAAGLAALSWLDDLSGLPVALRFSAHAAAVAAALWLMPDNLLVFQGWLPLWADRLAAGLAWVWFINLYNFMDGIDGLAGVETVAVCLGIFMVVAAAGAAGAAGVALAQAGIVTAGAAAGFLVLNWQPARVFMGDVGAIALGFLLGWFLLMLAGWGYWAAALILPAYYVADASWTLARRALGGEPVWRAHNTHFYQRAVQAGLSHARVVRFIALGNAFLIALAVASTQVVTWAGDLLCLGGAVLIAAWMLLYLGRAGEAPMP